MSHIRSHAIGHLTDRFVCPLMINCALGYNLYSDMEIDYRLESLNLIAIHKSDLLVCGCPHQMCFDDIAKLCGVKTHDIVSQWSGDQRFAQADIMSPCWLSLANGTDNVPTRLDTAWCFAMTRLVYRVVWNFSGNIYIKHF